MYYDSSIYYDCHMVIIILWVTRLDQLTKEACVVVFLLDHYRYHE